MSQTRARYRPICVGVMRPTCVDPEYISVGGFLVPAARASAEPDTAISTTLAAHNAQIAFVRVTVSPHAYRISTLPRRRKRVDCSEPRARVTTGARLAPGVASGVRG
jgi:hypothetical protein